MPRPALPAVGVGSFTEVTDRSIGTDTTAGPGPATTGDDGTPPTNTDEETATFVRVTPDTLSEGEVTGSTGPCAGVTGGPQ